jgi:hypothetical protein
MLKVGFSSRLASNPMTFVGTRSLVHTFSWRLLEERPRE